MIGRIAASLVTLLGFSSAVTASSSSQDCASSSHWQALFRSHLARYPAMGQQDAFKLLQQATVGSEHAISDTAMVAEWMTREWATMGEGGSPNEPLADTLGANGRYARIHLRTFRKAGGDPAALTAAFVRTGRVSRGDSASLTCAVRSLERLATSGAVSWSRDDVRRFFLEWSKAGYPAVSHTPAFRQRYSPAYRVVAVELISQLLPASSRR